MGFLEGTWRSITGLENVRTHEPLRMFFDFGPDGKGVMRIEETKPRQTCRGDVTAVLQDRTLTIHNSRRATCPSGNAFDPVDIVCRVLPGGAADCVIHQPSHPDVPVTLKR